MHTEVDGSGGYVYEGDWVMGVKEGIGQYTDNKTGSMYIGEFKQDAFHGKGQLKIMNG